MHMQTATNLTNLNTKDEYVPTGDEAEAFRYAEFVKGMNDELREVLLDDDNESLPRIREQ